MAHGGLADVPRMEPVMRLYLVALVAMACTEPLVEGPAGSPLDTGPTAPAPPDIPVADYPCATGALALELGTGVTAFAPLTPGEGVVMVDGPQTGWHVDVGGSLVGAPQLVEIDAVLYGDDGTLLFGDQAPVRTALVGWGEDACEGSFYGLRSMSGPSLDLEQVCALEGRSGTLVVTVTDLQAQPPVSVTGELTIAFALDPIDEPLCGS